MTDPQGAAAFDEAFCAELPSPCNLYLSGKRSAHRQRHPTPTTGGKRSSAPMIRFATERHSVALLQTGDADGGGGGEGYSLSVARLPSSSSSADGEDDGEGAKKTSPAHAKAAGVDSEDGDDVCLAHSSVSWDDEDSTHRQHPESSVEAFAMTRTPLAEHEPKEQKTCDASLTTHGSHSISEGGKEGGEATEQKPAEAAGSLMKNEGGGIADGKCSASPNYYLRVKCRVASSMDDKPGGVTPKGTSRHLKSQVEIIPLDFRPMSVHAAELFISSDRKEREGAHQPCSAIGLFVASVDDRQLRLYVATKDALRRRSMGKAAKFAPCFVPVPLYDASTASEDPGEAMGDNPLIFSTPIMAIDSCVTSEERSAMPDQEMKDVQLNRLAIACYDGTVRMMAYRLQNASENDDVPGLRFEHVRCSTFVVDGPIASLHFGKMSISEALQPPISSLFLVAGSLCGFACLFCEVTLPPSSDDPEGGTTPFFDGPLTIVDGLYDARREGFEDCVTAVHACCNTRNVPLIAVGTQGGRVLLFQQCQKKNNASTVSEDQLQKAKQEKEALANQISEKEEELSRLESEKEEMTAKAGENRGLISELQGKIDDLAATASISAKSESPEPITVPEEIAAGDSKGEGRKGEARETAPIESNEATGEEEAEPNDATILATAASDEVGVKEETAGQQDGKESQRANEASTLQIELESVQSQLLSLEEKIGDHASRIAKLISVLDDLTKQSTQKTIAIERDSMHTQRALRKVHRYEFLSEHHLPYPIHGIAHQEGGDVRAIFVSTRRSFHVFQEYLPKAE